MSIPLVDPNRIAIFVATSGHSGVDRTMHNLVPALANRGYNVDVLCVRRHGPSFKAIPPRVRLIDLGSPHVYTSFFSVCKYLKKNRPAVMLSDKDRVNRTALLAKAVTGVTTRLVLTNGTTISLDLAGRGPFERWLTKTSMGKLYPFADNIIVISKGGGDDMARYTGLDRSKIEVVPAPVVPESLLKSEIPRPDHPWFSPGELPVILGVGKLSPGKDYSTLIRAFAEIRRCRPCRLMILGQGAQREELISLAKTLGAENDLALLGFRHDVYNFMAHAAVFAHTSLFEGLGFVIIEALAVGTPVVATDCQSGPREILADGKYGELVPVRNHLSLAQSILRTLNNPLNKNFLREAALPYEIERSTTAHLRALGLPEFAPLR